MQGHPRNTVTEVETWETGPEQVAGRR
jgi:hypothetical protein